MKVRTVKSLNLPPQSLDVNSLHQECEHLRNIPIQSYQNVRPSILIGLDNWNLATPNKTVEGRQNQPIASKSRLGWSVEGPWHTALVQSTSNSFTCAVHVCNCERTDNESLHHLMKSHYEFDRLPYTDGPDSFSMDDQRALNILKNTVKKVNDQRYESGLLWKYDKFTLPKSRPMAVKRHICLERKLKNDPQLAEEMKLKIQAYVDKGYARKLTTDEIKNLPERTWYLPIFPVTNPNKPRKVRMVFNAAAKVDGISLNDMILKSPDLNALLYGVLVRFRQKKIATSGDISEMFHQIRIRPEDQHVQRFIWRDSPEEEFTEYVLEVLTFGASCSPCIAQYVKNFNADSFKNEFKLAAESMKKNCYVDDELNSVDTEEQAIELGQETIHIFKQGGFHIRNWRSNSGTVQEALEPNESPMKPNLDISGNDSIEKVLGMFWHTESDDFIFSFKFNKGSEAVLSKAKRATKRELLRIQMSIYDPLGLIANYIIQIKLLLQDIWRTGSDWDAEISDIHQKAFEEWLSHIEEIESLRIPRCYLSIAPNWNNVTAQLHIFVDAGEHAYASVAYLRMESTGGVDSRLVSAKTRVAPIEINSVQQLELEAARLGARHAKTIKETLDVPVTKTVYWSDSKTVLIWLKSDARSNPAFVAYRVSDIQDLTDVADWRWVPSSKNAADKYEIKSDSVWFQGPSFLYESEDKWPKEKLPKPTVTEIVTRHELIDAEPIIDSTKFSNWWHILRVVARMIHYRNTLLKKFRKQPPPVPLKRQSLLTSTELLEAEFVIIRAGQREEYSSEIYAINNGQQIDSKSKILGMNPFLDDKDILRSNSRLVFCTELDEYARMPIILPSKHHVTLLIVRYYHEQLNHQNHETVINNLRQRYWIPKLGTLFKKIRTRCNKCKILSATPQASLMAPLPECRLTIFRPFSHTGIDVWGPMYVTVGRSSHVRYGVIFTCMSTRAVHLEVVHSLSTNSFIMAFQRFISRRGKPRVVYSDNDTNFIGAERQLREKLKAVDQQTLAEKFTSPDLEWKFNPPYAPHMGGAWERLIRSIKRALYAMIPTVRRLTDETLPTVLAMIENTINARPLTYLPTDVSGTALTPNHFYWDLEMATNLCQRLQTTSNYL